MTELQKPLEDPTEPKNSFLERFRRNLRFGLDSPVLPVVMLLMMVAFAAYVYIDPKPGEVETVKETSSEVEKEPTVKEAGTYKVREETVKGTIRAAGVVRATQSIKLYAASDGPVKGLPAAIGGKVTTDTVVVELGTDALQKKVDRAKTADELARTNLSEAKSSSEARPEDVKIAQLTANLARSDLDAAQADLSGTKIKAPRAGRLDVLYVTEGQVVKAGQLLAEVVEPDNYIIETWVDDSDAFALKIDDAASISFASRPAETYKAKIAGIGLGTSEDQDYKGVPVRLQLTKGQSTEWLRTGLRGAKVEIRVARLVVPVPREAVSSQGDSHVVFVQTDKRFSPRAVSIGLFDEKMVEVVEGLVAGEIIAAD